ncbi:transposase [Polaribacter sp. IC073]|nr:transposase [Polaribacter sp. IC073]
MSQSKFNCFNSIVRKMSIHDQSILNYFDHGSINASAASLITKVKPFRAQYRTVRNIEFFLFKRSTLHI